MKWVLVSDRLPEKNGRYFVFAQVDFYGRIVKGAVDFYNGIWHIGKKDKVIKWLDENGNG